MLWMVIGVLFAFIGASCAAVGGYLVCEIAAVIRKVLRAEISYSFMYPARCRRSNLPTRAFIPPERWKVGV